MHQVRAGLNGLGLDAGAGEMPGDPHRGAHRSGVGLQGEEVRGGAGSRLAGVVPDPDGDAPAGRPLQRRDDSTGQRVGEPEIVDRDIQGGGSRLDEPGQFPGDGLGLTGATAVVLVPQKRDRDGSSHASNVNPRCAPIK